MELLRILTRESRYELCYILFLSGFAGVAGALIVLLVLNAVQDVATGTHYLFYAVSLPILTVVLLLTKRAAQKRVSLLTEDLLEHLLLEITNRIRHVQLLEVEQRDHTEILLTLVSTQTVGEAATKMVNALQLSISLAISWGYIVWLSPEAGFIWLLAFALALGVYKIFQALTSDAVREEAQKHQELLDSFHHVLDGFKELKLNSRKSEDLFENYLFPGIAQNQALRTKTAFYFSEYHIFTDICSYVAMGSIGVVLLSMGMSDRMAMIFVTIIYQAKLWLVLLAQFPDIIKGQMALQHVRQLAEAEVPPTPVSAYMHQPAREIVQQVHTITFHKIHFAYPPVNGTPGFSIGPLDLTIQAGELLFLSGGNGSGKSTLLKLLTGLYSPSAGTFVVDKRTLASMTEYRYLFSAVFSDFHLFDRLYGLEDIEEQEVNQWLRQMELFPRVQWKDGRFSTLQLSTGQKKRLALVAAILEDKPIYVFDEWAADQAPHFREFFYTELLCSLQDRGKTVIVVSHDDRYFGVADRLLTMDYGQITEEQPV